MRAPFEEITIDGNTFDNIVGYPIHRFGGAISTSDPDAVLNIRNNTFSSSLLEAGPQVQEQCECELDGPINCYNLFPDGMRRRDAIYRVSGQIVLDSSDGLNPKDYMATITGNTFWGGSGINAVNPATVTGNVFRTYRLPTDPPSQYDSTAAVFHSPGSVFRDNQVDSGISVSEGATDVVISGNTCIECSTLTDHGAYMVYIGGARAQVRNNNFRIGTGNFEVTAPDVAYCHNTVDGQPLTPTLSGAGSLLPCDVPGATSIFTGAAGASTAIAVDERYMFVGDDENQAIRLYDRTQSGGPR